MSNFGMQILDYSKTKIIYRRDFLEFRLLQLVLANSAMYADKLNCFECVGLGLAYTIIF